MLIGEFELGNFDNREITERNILEKKYSDLKNPGMRTIKEIIIIRIILSVLIILGILFGI